MRYFQVKTQNNQEITKLIGRRLREEVCPDHDMQLPEAIRRRMDELRKADALHGGDVGIGTLADGSASGRASARADSDGAGR
ncbi:MAG: hypothetical protein WC829_12585 [Hyphomicrobium sp.]|jgi:hypothetical protein